MLHDSNYYLAHHGIFGMHWGIRRFQNKDGSLTAAGEKRYNKDSDENSKNQSKTKLDEEIKKAGLDKRISDKNRQILQSYTRSSQKYILNYMKKNPGASFNKADRAETKQSIAKGLAGLALSVAVAAYFSSKMRKQTEALISESQSMPIKNLSAKSSICITGKEYIDMMYTGRKQLF